MLDSITLQSVPIKILGISGSPRHNSNSEAILAAALDSASATGQVELSEFRFYRKKIQPCLHCGACAKTKRCGQKDDLNELFDLWIDVDAVIYATPVYQMGISGQLKCAIDRLGHVIFSSSERTLPRLMKVGGVIAQGNCRQGGQETAMLQIIQHLLTMNCIPVPGDTPDSYIGAGGVVANLQKGGIVEDEVGMSAARSVGKRVAEVAKILKVGRETLKGQLPSEYVWRHLLLRPDG
jgi:multimeric flavodoxin WrbA